MGYSVPSPVCWQMEGPAEVSGAPKNSYNGSSSPHSAGSQIWLQTLAIPISLGFLFSQLRVGVLSAEPGAGVPLPA